MSKLSGKTALVTGASAGIGLATARLLSEAGVRLIGCARRLDALRAQTDELPGPPPAGPALPTAAERQQAGAYAAADGDADQRPEGAARLPNSRREIPALGLQPRGGGPSDCLLYTSPSPRDLSTSRMPSSA